MTRRGRPPTAVVPLQGVDLESLSVSSGVFIEIVERARERFRQGGGISLQEMKERWLTAAHTSRSSRKPSIESRCATSKAARSSSRSR
jgi:hypothetical protein